jgi:hypothetical protein
MAPVAAYATPPFQPAPVLPTMPLNFVVTDVEEHALTFIWAEPLSTGGLPITGYRVSYEVEVRQLRVQVPSATHG